MNSSLNIVKNFEGKIIDNRVVALGTMNEKLRNEQIVETEIQ